MHRFFVPSDWIDSDAVSLTGDVSRQIARVLRLRPGEQIIVLDNTGFEYIVTLDEVSPSSASGLIVDKRPSQGEPRTSITLYQGTLKADKFEFVLQKGTELGIGKFVPMVSERSVRRESEHSDSRTTRWQRIIKEAAEQSRRGRLPVLGQAISFQDACASVEGHSIIPWEEESSNGLKTHLQKIQADGQKISSLNMLIGPEGGFSADEVRYAVEQGISPVTLGKRILRAETAGIAVTAATMYELGEMVG